MAKFKYNKKNGRSFIMTLVSGEQTDGYTFNNIEIQSYHPIFLRPCIYKNGEITFSFKYEDAVPLSRFLRNPVNKDQFYIIIAQLLEAYKIMVNTNIDPARVCLDTDVITIRPSNGYIYLVYQPVLNLKSPNQGFMRCFAQICSMLKYASPQDQADIGGFIGFAGRLPSFMPDEIEKFIRNASPIAYKYIEGNLCFNTGLPVNSPAMEPARPDSGFAPMNGNVPIPEQNLPVPPAEQPHELTARLIRRSNGETIMIDKESFVIGKERARVNYCVDGNKTVSRVHATIFCRSGEYYVCDNNSLNKTFINGSQIPVMTEMKLNSRDVLKLSNEEFDFINN